MRQIFDIIRQKWVAATPEEMVRQSWITKMVRELSFPPELIAVEKDLRTLPHLCYLSSNYLPRRRIDILSFTSRMQPLLLVECKNNSISRAAMDQAVAYNSFVQASFVGIVSCGCILLQSRQGEMSRLPPFPDLENASLMDGWAERRRMKR